MNKVTVIVVNYNSKRKWEVVGESLRSILSLRYRPLEVIIVDNGSDDGSYELIRDLVGKVQQSEDFRVKLVRLPKNYGFAVANNIAYRLKDPSSKYVALINNDLAPEPNSLNKLVNILETDPKIAGVQGVILTWDRKHIDNFGFLITSHGRIIGIAQGLGTEYVDKFKPTIVTFLSGAFSIYRIEALGNERIFLPYFFMFGDDNELGIRLWRSGWRLVAVPIIAGRHYGGASYRLENNSMNRFVTLRIPYTIEYWNFTANCAITVLYERLWLLQIFKEFIKIFTITLLISLQRGKNFLRAMIDGLSFGLKLRKRIKLLNTTKEPKLYINYIKEFILLIKLYLYYGKHAESVYGFILTKLITNLYTIKKKYNNHILD